MIHTRITTLENDITVIPHFPTGDITAMGWVVFLCVGMRHALPPVEAMHPVGTVSAFVNRSRWLAQCPFCPLCMPASKHDPLLWCIQCRMKRNGGHSMRVRFPDAETMRTIEIILSMREQPETRNWMPSETIQVLARENIEHGAIQLYTGAH